MSEAICLYYHEADDSSNVSNIIYSITGYAYPDDDTSYVSATTGSKALPSTYNAITVVTLFGGSLSSNVVSNNGTSVSISSTYGLYASLSTRTFRYGWSSFKYTNGTFYYGFWIIPGLAATMNASYIAIT